MSSAADATRAPKGRVRMSGAERREQLIVVARAVFAERGYEGTSVEEIAARAEVSKPVIYEHFGGKEGLYAVVVDREVRTLHDAIRKAITTPRTGPRRLLELGTRALLDYIEAYPDGFQILARDTGGNSAGSSFASILSDIVARVEDLLADAFTLRDLDPKAAPLYAQALTGMVALTGQWWLDNQEFTKDEVAVHLTNLGWNGMRNLRTDPVLHRGKTE